MQTFYRLQYKHLKHHIRLYSTKSSFPIIHQTKFKTKIEYKFNQEGQITFTKLVKEKKVEQKSFILSILYHFLPKGYPHSVTENYSKYCQWSAFQYMCSSICGVLSTQAMLVVLTGMTSLSAAPLAAAMNWVIKDGLGQLGGVLFASWVSTNFDADPKKWRMRGEIALGCATMMEVCTSLFPQFFIPLASIANIGKNVSCLAGSATRAAMNQSFSKKNNLGDVTAKATSQTIAASLIGTAIGIGISPLIGSAFSSVFPAFCCIFALQIFALYKAVSNVQLNTFNLQRIELFLKPYLTNKEILSPKEVSKMEIFMRKFKSPFKIKIKINENLNECVTNLNEMNIILKFFKDLNYIIHLKKVKTFWKEEIVLFVILKKEANTNDIIQAMYHACKIRESNIVELKDPQSIQEYISQFLPTREEMECLKNKMVEAGWNITHDDVEEKQNRLTINF